MNIDFEKNEYIFKIIYLIRSNLPSSEYLYIIMFFIKFVGLILISVSLNEWKKESNSSYNFVYHFFSKFVMSGKDLKLLNKNYQEFCILGFCILLVYIFIIIFGFLYVRDKYSNKYLLSSIEKKIKNISNNSKFEKNLFKIISYIFFLIVFFHQYIIEFFLFGFLGYFLNIFEVFESNDFENANDLYKTFIKEHLKNMNHNPIVIMILNLFIIILIFLIFILFMTLNSTKGLFLNNGFPLYGNKQSLIIKLFFCSYNPFHGIINSLSKNLKIKITLSIIIIFSIIILLDIMISFYYFSFYQNKLSYLYIFIEFFSLFSNFTELIIYLTNSLINSLKFNLIKLVLEFINSLIFTFLFFYKKEENNLKMFADNLFNKTFKNLNQNDIYFYIKSYIKYSQNKEKNYIKLFRIIQNHTLSCNKKECPDKILIPNYLSYSEFTSFSIIKIEDTENKIEEKANNNNMNNNNNKILPEPNNIKIKNYNFTSSSKQITIKDNSKNMRVIINEEESKKSILKKIRATETMRKNLEKTIKDSSFVKLAKKNSLDNMNKDNNNNLNDNIKLNDNTDNNIINKDLNINSYEKRKLKDEEFQMIGEQEIINRINFLYKRKDYSNLENYIFIHLQYLIKIKQNYRLALYFIGKYSNSDIKTCFLAKYYLYEIKKYICKNIINSKNLINIEDSYIIKYRKENIYLKKLIKYLLLYYLIKKLLKICCQKIIYFYTFRLDLHNSLTLQKYIKSKIHPVIKSAEDIQLSIYKLKFLLEKYNKNEKIIAESIELSYLISNFFKLFDGKITQDILKYISPILSFKEIYYEQLLNEFHIFMMSNPLIISLTKKDSFNISYFTNHFLNKLGYIYSDLKNQDFHEKLFPGGQEIIKEHSYMMKQFLFFSSNEFTKTNTFIKSKEGYLISINFTCKILPNFSNDFYYISNIIFNDDSLSEFNNRPIEYNKKTNNFIINNDKINTYSFLLDYDFDFFGLTKNFYLEYDLNQNMFRELRINFCQFFCIDENKIIEQMHIEKKKLFKKYPIFNQKISLRESNKAYTIFQNIKIENLFKIRDEKFLESYFYPSIFIYDKIDKKKLIRKFPEIISIIDEIGLDYDWYIRLLNFKERLIMNSKFQNIKESNLNSMGQHHNNPYMGGENKNTSIIEKINYETNCINFPEQFFEVIFSIKKLGSVSYYIVNLLEKINSNCEPTKIEIEGEESINKRNSDINLFNKKFKKLSSKKNIKINFLSSPAKTIKGEKVDEEANSIKRNARTKVFFKSPTINSLSKKAENITNKEKANLKEASRKNLELVLENNVNKNEEGSKNNNITTSKDESKSQKISKIFDNLEFNHNNKSKNKESFEDEENVPLITRDKFIDLLKKYNKRDKILNTVIFIIIHVTLILIIVKFIICMVGFQLSETVLKTTIYLEQIKVDIYVQAILSIISCINDEKIYSKSSILLHSEAISKNRMTIEHLKILQNNINIIFNNKYCKEITKILKEKLSVYYLNLDWTISEEKVDILEEIRKMSYKTYGLAYNNETCQINKFYKFNETGNNFYIQGNPEESNTMQKTFYYFLRNTLLRYKTSFDKLSEECSITIEKMFFNYQNILFYLLIFIIIILLIFIITYIFKICFDYSYYHLLFIYYYNIENSQLKFENQIYFLYKTIIDFNFENISNFEYIKSKDYLMFDNENISNSYSNIIKNNNILKSNIDNSISSPKRNNNNKRNNSSFKNNSEIDKNKIPEQNNMNASNLNGSMNGSSLQFLNNSNKKISLNNNNVINNNNTISSNKSDKEQKIISQEESIDSLLKISNKILPISSQISFIFIILGILLYFGLAIANIIESNNEKSIWRYSINLSLNILERIPRLMELLIYSCITVISNNQTIIEGSPYKDNQPKYLTYFKVNSLYYSDDTMNKYFKNSFFGELLRDNLRIDYNFNNYLSQEKNNIFKNTKHWENLLSTSGYFCIYAAMGEKLNIQENGTLYEFIKSIESSSLNCLEDNTGINESGVKLEITFILQELANKYIEFITFYENNMNISEAREYYFASKDIIKIFNDMQYSLILYYNTIINTVYLDFENQSKTLVTSQIIYDGLLFLINCLIITCLTFVIIKGEKYKKLFAYFSEIPKTNNYYS